MSTTATLTPKPGNQLWGIYFTDREYAHLMGDPIRTVVEEPTKRAAEVAAGNLGFESPWAHPVTAEQAKQACGFLNGKKHSDHPSRASIHTASTFDHANTNKRSTAHRGRRAEEVRRTHR